MKLIKKIYQWIVSGLIVLFFSLTIYVLVAGTIAMKNKEMISLFGYTYSVVPTDSMEPEIMVGDSVIAKKVDFEDLEIGNDIIYHYVTDKLDIFIVHRIIREENGGFITQGINNNSEDDVLVTEDNYVAKVVWSGKAANIGELVLHNRDLIFLILTIVLLLICVNGVFDILKILEAKKKLEYEESEKEAISSTEITDELREKLRKEVEKELMNQNNENDEKK